MSNYEFFTYTELLDSTLFSDTPVDNTFAEFFDDVAFEDELLEHRLPNRPHIEEASYGAAFLDRIPVDQACINTALIFALPTKMSDSDTESEPSTPRPRRSPRLPTASMTYTNPKKPKSARKKTTIKRHRTVSAAGAIKKDALTALYPASIPPSKIRRRSEKSIAASEARRKAVADKECPYEGCPHKYTSYHHLKAHINKHEDAEKKYCLLCGYFSFNVSDIKRHMRLRH